MYSVINITCKVDKQKLCSINRIVPTVGSFGKKVHTLGLSLCVSVQYLWNLTMFGCSNCVRFSNTNWIFSSCDLKFFLSENWTSFHTTSTPSSVSMARWAQSIPGTSRCSTCWLKEKNFINLLSDNFAFIGKLFVKRIVTGEERGIPSNHLNFSCNLTWYWGVIYKLRTFYRGGVFTRWKLQIFLRGLEAGVMHPIQGEVLKPTQRTLGFSTEIGS